MAFRAFLPCVPTPFVGRAAELAQVERLLREPRFPRLVTLTGPPGVGKTRLALAAAERSATAYAQGAAFVDVSGVTHAHELPEAVLEATGGVGGGTEDAPTVLHDWLAERHLLLLLDNVEQVEDAGPAVAAWLERCPDLTVMATSRRPLEVRAEQCIDVLPLPVPDPADDEARLRQNPSLGFLLQRMQACGSAPPEGADLAVAAEVCRRLDGLPLALELAASRTRTLPLAQVREALAARLAALGRGPTDLPARQRTLEAAIDWSCGLLSPRALMLMRRLAVLATDADVAVATALMRVGGGSAEETGAALEELTRHHLLQLQAGSPEPRFRQLEVVRTIGLAKLERHEERREVDAAHARHFLSVAESLAPELDSAGQAPALQRLVDAADDLAKATDWAVGAGEADLALRLCLALRFLWYVRGSLPAGRRRFAAALALPGAEPSLRARTLVEACALARHAGDFDGAEGLARAALRQARDLGGPALSAAALLHLGFVRHVRGDLDEATHLLEESLRVHTELGAPLGVARARLHLGIVAGRRGDLPAARRLQTQCLREFRDLGHGRHEATVLLQLSHLAAQEGQPAEAADQLVAALALVQQLSDLPLLLHALHLAAPLALRMDRAALAVELLGAAEGLTAATGAVAWPVLQRDAERCLVLSRRRLGTVRVDELRRAGRRAEPWDACERARLLADGPGDPLSPREREVAALVAEGLTNRAVAVRLVVSERTVDGHVARALAKLGFRSRTQLATWFSLGQPWPPLP